MPEPSELFEDPEAAQSALYKWAMEQYYKDNERFKDKSFAWRAQFYRWAAALRNDEPEPHPDQMTEKDMEGRCDAEVRRIKREFSDEN